MVSDPYVDNTPDGSLVAPRGDILFLKVAVRDGEGGPIVAPDSDWLDWDGGADSTTVRTIKDPDDNPVTSNWETIELDPDDSDDDWDDDHADYVGDPDDDNTHEHRGLFHNGSGRIAQKVKVPSDAEKTVDDSDRTWSITWEVRKGDNVVTKTENFNVGAAGVLIFSADLIQVAEVTAGINTSLSDTEVEELIKEATDLWAEGRLLAADVDIGSWDVVPPLVRSAVINYTRGLISQRDVNAGNRVARIREGDKTINYSSSRESVSGAYFEAANGQLDEYLQAKAPSRAPSMDVHQRKRWQNVLQDHRGNKSRRDV